VQDKGCGMLASPISLNLRSNVTAGKLEVGRGHRVFIRNGGYLGLDLMWSSGW